MMNRYVVDVRRFKGRKGLRNCKTRAHYLTAHYSGGRDSCVLVMRDLITGDRVAIDFSPCGTTWLERTIGKILDERLAHKSREVHHHDPA